MVADENDENRVKLALQLSQHFWTEFHYRHDLIWQRIFRFTAAVVIISIIPYAQPVVAKLLGYWILLAPLLATFLGGFTFFVIRHELKLFERIATSYMIQQNKLFDDDEPKHDISARRRFGDFVQFYLFILTWLSFIHGLIIWLVWIPALASATPDVLK